MRNDKTFFMIADIDESITREFAEWLKANVQRGDHITIEMMSHGGLVFCGLAIAQMIDMYRNAGTRFTCNVFGISASAAADVALACDEIYMAREAVLMVHGAYGGTDEGIKLANERQLALIKSKLPDFEPSELESDNWLDAKTCVESGLAKGFISTESVSAASAKVAAKYNHLSNGERKTMSGLKEKAAVLIEAVKAEAPCNEEEKKEQEQPKAEDASAVDVLEQIVQRLDEIEHRLGVLEGEGKKSDDEAEIENGDQIAARLNGLYARLTAEKPVVSSVTGNAAVSKQSKLEASFERSKAINLKAYM